MGKLLEGFKISCTDFDHSLEKRRETVQRRTNQIYYSREDTNLENKVCIYNLAATKWKYGKKPL